MTTADPGYRHALAIYTQAIMNMGVSSSQAPTTAFGQIYKELLHQASILAYRDAYDFVAIILIVLGIAALFMPGNILKKKASAAAVQ